MQTVLRILLVATLVVAAKASIANRVVPEEQFYDDASENSYNSQQAATDAVRSDRASATNTGSGSIETLLTTLLTNIGNERTTCQTEFKADSKVCTDTHTDAMVLPPLPLFIQLLP